MVIGDIHGGLQALIQVLERAEVTSKDTLIFLGDYVDGWSESAQTITYLIELSQQGECIFIKGNHDVYCERFLKSGQPDRVWLFQGGASTQNSYQGVDEAVQIQHLHFFERMPLYHIDVKNRLFIHAGFTSFKGPEQEIYAATCTTDRTLWELALAMNTTLTEDSIRYPKRLRRFHEIYIGHTPTLRVNSTEPLQAANVWNMDTGAAFHGKLSIMDIDSKQIWQSDPVSQLYPNEEGRSYQA